jgi:hypothetical protein
VTTPEGLTRRRAERAARLLEHGLGDFLREEEQRLIDSIVQAEWAATLTDAQCRAIITQLATYRTLHRICERARQQLTPPAPKGEM